MPVIFTQDLSDQEYEIFLKTEGLTFHFGQNAEDTILLRLFQGRRDGFYVDVGAFHPKKYSNTYLLHKFFGWKGINIDASDETIKEFNKDRPGDINLNYAVGLEESEQTLFKFSGGARNTLSPQNVKRQINKSAAVVVDETTVRVRPLSSMLKESMKPGRIIDLINIDVEGFDMQALQSNDWSLFSPRVLLIEDYAVAQEGLEKSEIYKFLTNRGYRFNSHNFDTSIYLHETFVDSAPDEDPKIQKLKEELKNIRMQKFEITQKVEDRKREASLFTSRTQEALNSKSWKYTAPVRSAAKRIRAKKGGADGKK
jgi:FkbM family methyltransferase